MAGKNTANKKNTDGEMTFLQHLEELRWHIIRALVAVVAGAIIAFVFKNVIFDHIILAPNNPDFITNRLLCRLADLVNAPVLCINQDPIELISIKMSGQFTTHINISLVAGLILAFPYVFWEFWSFFRPALYEKERKYARGAVTMASLLFVLGILFGYFIITPLSINFLGTYRVSDVVTNQINITSYIGSVTSVALSAGITFELPIVVFFLARIGVLTPAFMRKYRRHAIVIVLIVAAVITPPDVFSLILVSIPLLLLYEVSIFIASRVVKDREKADAAEAAVEAAKERAEADSRAAKSAAGDHAGAKDQPGAKEQPVTQDQAGTKDQPGPQDQSGARDQSGAKDQPGTQDQTGPGDTGQDAGNQSEPSGNL